MAGWHHRLDGRESEWTPRVGDGQGGLACCNSWGLKELDTTERLNWTELCAMSQLLFALISQFSHSAVSNSATPWLQHTRPPCPSPTPRVYSNSCPLSQWCHPTISSSDVPFSSHPQSFLASGSLMSQFFTSGGQSIGVSALASVLPMNIQDWFLLGWTGWISLLSKGLSRVFSNTTVQKHQFFGAQLSLYSNSHIHTWLLLYFPFNQT